MPKSKIELTPELLLNAYASGYFPMAESASSDKIFWLDPELRGIIPLDGFHVSKSLKKTMRRGYFQVKVNQNFKAVMQACAKRKETWINDQIIEIYTDLHRLKHAHSVEVYHQNQLVGGVYGVSLQGAFFGESMFSKQVDMSKIALTYLVALLKSNHYQLLDTQFITSHLESVGGVEITRDEYKNKLTSALDIQTEFPQDIQGLSPQGAIHLSTQIS